MAMHKEDWAKVKDNVSVWLKSHPATVIFTLGAISGFVLGVLL